MNKINCGQSNNGFALTEVLLAIAIIIIVGIAAYPLYKNARTSSEVEEMANDIAILQTNTQKLYFGQSGYAGINLNILNNAGLVPDDLKPVTVAGNGTNVWGGSVFLAPGPTIENGFAIAMTNVPKSACTQLITNIAPSFLVIGTTTGSSYIKDETTNKNKIDIAVLNQACNSLGSTIYFYTK